MSEQNERMKELEKLVKQGNKVLETACQSSNPNAAPEVKEEKFHAFRIASLSWLSLVFNNDHICSQSFKNEVTHATVARTKRALGILEAAKTELNSNWLPTTKSSLARDILSSMLHHAQREYEENHLQAAAILCGAVTDELLRRICLKAKISLVNDQLQGKPAAKKALQLTGEAYKKKAFDRTTNKQFIACIELATEQTQTNPPKPEGKKIGQAITTLQKIMPALPL